MNISRYTFINAISTRSKVISLIWRKKDATKELAYMISLVECNMLGK